MPRFSVVSPVYNTSAHLAEFLDSVIAQTYPDYELILVDDGSSDNSPEICRKYESADSRVKVLTQQNQGAGAARNRGIEAASGDYLLFFDSDDWIHADTLRILSDALSENQADLLIFGAEWVTFSHSKKEIGRTPIIPDVPKLSDEKTCREHFCGLVFSSVLNQPWNKVYRRDFIMRHNVRFADTRRAQDAFFNMDYYRHIKSLDTISDVLYYYRENTQEKVWKKYPKDLYKIDVRYNAALENLCKEFGVYDGRDRERVDRWFFMSVMRDAGFYRNPLWKLTPREKRAYVSEVITDPYILARAKRSLSPDKRSQTVKKRILASDPRGLMRDIRSYYAYLSCYEWYRRGKRRVFKRKNG